MQNEDITSCSIKNYKLLKLLGSGAAAQVYLAEFQHQLRAVKVLHSNEDKSLLQRFQLEKEILTTLDHDRITSLLDSGMTEQGQLFIAMDFIEGLPLNEFVAGHSLSLNQLLDIIQQCAEVIQFAHQHGVVHRDLKPSNIIIDSQFKVYIVDFGIARIMLEKLPELTRLTEQGQILGTLPYMSPEQIQGEVSKVTYMSDLYSLGIISYELLAGYHPFNLHGASLSEALDRVLNAPVKPASSFNPQLSEELDRILAQSVSREINQRYLSVEDFIDDLKRYQSGKKIKARTLNTWYELRQIYHRHRLPFITFIVIFAISTVSSGVSSWFAWQEKKARQETEIQMKKARNISDFLIHMLTSADPDSGRGDDLTVRDLVLEAATNIPGNIRDPELEAGIRCTLGNSLRSLGKYKEAAQQIELAMIKAEQGSEAFGQCQIALGILQSHSGNREQARITLNAIESQKGSNNWVTIQTELAVMEGLEGDPRASIERLRNILALPDENLPLSEEQRLVALHDYASMLREDGQYEQAKQTMHKVIAEKTRLYGENHPQTLYSLNNLGTILIQTNELGEAEALFKKLIKSRTEIYGEGHIRVINTSLNLLNVLVTEKKLDEADRLSQQLLQTVDKYPVDQEKLIQLMSMRAFLLEDMGQLVKAEKLYRKSLELMAKKDGRSVIELLPVRNNLAMLLMHKGRYQEALEEFNTLLDDLQNQLGKEHVYYAIIENNYGESLGKSGHIDEALQHLRSSHQQLLKIFGEKHERVLKSSRRIAAVENI